MSSRESASRRPDPLRVTIMQSPSAFSLTIGGHGVATSDYLPVLNPATRQPIGQCPVASEEHVEQARAAAGDAFAVWRQVPYGKRCEQLQALAGILEAHLDELAQLLTHEQGKPLADARGELAGAIAFCQCAGSLPLPEVVHEQSATRLSKTVREPLGVVVAIVPWNYPVSIAFVKPDRRVGCRKHADSQAGADHAADYLRIGELIRDALPAGVINVLAGNDDLGPWLTGHADVAKISFTGSSVTGRHVARSAAADLKRLTLELGGNDAAVVMADSLSDAVVERVFWSAFTNAGQICMATKRLYIHESIYEAFRDKLVAYAQNVVIGDGSQPGVTMGPLQNAKQFAKVMSLIDAVRQRGGRLIECGQMRGGDGYFLPITFVDLPDESAPEVVEEAFGPLLPLLKFRDVDEVIERVNAARTGWLAASGVVIGRSAHGLQQPSTRSVWSTTGCDHAVYSFGGMKASGYGAESGLEGLLEFTTQKTVIIQQQ
uniref:Probable aldehyde dehydrogenase n=1 Tax=Pseudomonas sp. TaxID=306 RepID=ALDH_PSESP|nr:RecName: Full=Probable aldehyde dehydrogenase [Pseudomonas sp.]AAA25995.1 aldehyde dehydrogenase [Pseudomonas sp.]